MLNRVTLLLLLSIFTVFCSPDAYATLYTDHETKTDADIYHVAVKYYDPYAGRFISRDPAGDGLNWYAYANNNPMKYTDPNGLRPVNANEMSALQHTFGDTTADYLASVIDVQIDENLEARGLVKNNTQIFLNSEYVTKGGSGSEITWLSTFIHEATHIWQRHTGRHRGGKGGVDYEYTREQLLNNDLKIEEHAAAVSDWFFVDYGWKQGWIGAKNFNIDNDTVQTTYVGAWARLFRSLGHNDPTATFDLSAFQFRSRKYLQAHVDYYYGGVIKEIRNSNILVPAITIRAF